VGRSQTPSRVEHRRLWAKMATPLMPSKRIMQAALAEDFADEDSFTAQEVREATRTPTNIVAARRAIKVEVPAQKYELDVWSPAKHVNPAGQKQFDERMSRPRRVAALPTPVRSVKQTAEGRKAQRSLHARLTAGSKADTSATAVGPGFSAPCQQAADTISGPVARATAWSASQVLPSPTRAASSTILADSGASPSGLDAASIFNTFGSSSVAALFGRDGLHTHGQEEGEGATHWRHAAPRELGASAPRELAAPSSEAWLEQPPKAFEPEDSAERAALVSALAGAGAEQPDESASGVSEAWQTSGRSASSLRGKARLAPLAAHQGLVGWQLARGCSPWA